MMDVFLYRSYERTLLNHKINEVQKKIRATRSKILDTALR